jgi:hypothetical protein
MKSMRILLAIAAGTSLIGASAEAQNKMAPVRPGRPQIQPVRPGGPQIQPPRPQPPRPVKPRPPKPPRPRPPVHHHRPVVVHHVWNHYHPAWAYGHAVLYSGNHYSGQALTIRHNIPDLGRYGFGDRANSIHTRGRWQICNKTSYRGGCVTVRGSDPYLGRLSDRVSSIRYLGH